MNLNTIQYLSLIDKQKLQMQELLHNGVVSIILPTTPSKNEYSIQENKPANNNKTIMLAGGAAILSGLIVGNPLKWILIGAGVASVLYGTYSNKNNPSYTKVNNLSNSPIDYVGLASRVNRSLAKVNSSITNAWDDFISEQKGKLKNEILASNADTDTKDHMLNAATSTSVIDISMTQFTMKVNAAANKSDVNALRAVLADFESAMNQAIVTTCEEQKAKWGRI